MTKQLVTVVIGAAAAVVLALAAGGCAPKAKEAGGPAIGPVDPNNFVIAWKAPIDLKNDAITELHLRDSNLYAYTRNDVVYSLSRGGGGIQYMAPVKASGGVLRPPVELKDRIVFPTATTMEIYRPTGTLDRRFPLDYSTRSPANGLENTLYVGLDYPRGGRIAAIDVSRAYANNRGELLTRGGVSAMPAIHQNVVYIGGEDGRVYAVTNDLKAVWPLEGGVFVTSGRIVGDVKADDSGVYVASTDSKLYALDRGTGKILWQYYGGKPLTSSPHVTANTVYINVPDRGLVAIEKGKGDFTRKAKWVSKDARKFLAEDDTRTYLSTRDGKIQAVDRQTGKVLFVSKGRGYDVFVSNPKDNIIYAARKGGTVVAIKPVLEPGVVGEQARNDTGYGEVDSATVAFEPVLGG